MTRIYTVVNNLSRGYELLANNNSQVLTRRPGRRILPSMGKLGTFVRQHRERLGLGVIQAAELWGMTPGSLSMIERGERSKIQIETLFKLAEGTGVAVEELAAIARETPPKEATPRQPPKNGRRSGKATAST